MTTPTEGPFSRENSWDYFDALDGPPSPSSKVRITSGWVNLSGNSSISSSKSSRESFANVSLPSSSPKANPLLRVLSSIVSLISRSSSSDEAKDPSIERTLSDRELETTNNPMNNVNPSIEETPKIEAFNIEILMPNELLTKDIVDLVHELGSNTNNISHLAVNGLRLSNTGNRLRDAVHPFAFLLVIFRSETSRSHMQTIFNCRNNLLNGRIWKDFASNWGKNIEARRGHGNIDPYIPSFAIALEIDANQITLHIQEKQWSDLLQLTLKLKSAR